MTSPQIKILISLASISIIYAFICEIRLTQKARILADLIKNEFPELWQELNLVARNWNGGHPGLKLLYRRKVVDLPNFDREYRRLQALERQLVLGVITGSVCIGLVALGLFYWGWHW
jgi:hypothetical protein